MENNPATFLFSVGAISTHFHVLSTESQKYFERAILMSGSALSLWALSEKNDHTELAFEIADSWNKPQKNVNDLIEVLRNAPPESFLESSRVVPTLRLTIQMIFGPVVESMTSSIFLE